MKSVAMTLTCVVGLVFVGFARAQSQATASQPAASGSLYVVEIKIGPGWDNNKKPHEQAYFREHSANLKRLRDQGYLILGARYSDKGLVVLQASSEQEAHAMMQQDSSVQNKVFLYELHEFNVFYSGSVQAHPRRK